MDNDTIWIERLKSGDVQATQEIWQRYYDKVTEYAKRKLRDLPRREMDEEDVALSAFHSLFTGVSNGKFPKLDDREDLWKLLATIAARKASTQYKRHLAQKRGSGSVGGESVFAGKAEIRNGGIDQFADEQPSPSSLVVFTDTLAYLMRQLNDETLQRIATLRMEGFDNEEIAAQLGCVRRTVERKLELIRLQWMQANDEDNNPANIPQL